MSTTIRLRPIDMCCDDVVAPEPLGAEGQQRLTALFKALGDPTRLGIFRLIAAQVRAQPICACDIVDRFQVTQPTVAHHTKILREAGLITTTRRGIWAYYAVAPQGAALLRDAAGLVLGTPERVAAGIT